MRESVVLKIGGRTGEGIDSAGELLARMAHEAGLYVTTYRTFPPIIKGGMTSYEVRASTRPVAARGDAVDVLIAFDAENLGRWRGECGESGVVVVDVDRVTRSPADRRIVALPLSEMARAAGSPIVRNVVAVGFLAACLGLPSEQGKVAIAKVFGEKGEKVVEQNARAFAAGYEAACGLMEAGHLQPPRLAPPRRNGGRLLLSGNEAMAFGALAARCKVFAGYPITPATEIMEWLAEHLPYYGGTVIQTEDEIAALCTVIGASYAGVRAMTATSGPGFSLMTEALGLAAMTETPAVIVDVQRPGPSAGMPTKHEQSDIQHALYAGHGDLPRIVIAPGTVADCFHDIIAAFNLADRHQCPVIVLSDHDLALRKQTVDEAAFDVEGVVIDRGRFAESAEGFKRYALTEDGISPRALPGQPGFLFLASGDEHDDAGVIDVDLPDVRRKMVEKRMRKLQHVDFEPYRLHGRPDAPNVAIGIGAVTGPLAEAVGRLPDWTFVQLRRLWPFPTRELAPVLAAATRIAVVEHNALGHLDRLIRAEMACHGKVQGIRKYDGTPFTPGELERALRALSEGGTVGC